LGEAHAKKVINRLFVGCFVIPNCRQALYVARVKMIVKDRFVRSLRINDIAIRNQVTERRVRQVLQRYRSSSQ